MIAFNILGGWWVMAYPDATMLLIICYVFGILTAVALYFVIVAPTEKKRFDKGYTIGFMDGIKYAERGSENDYLSV